MWEQYSKLIKNKLKNKKINDEKYQYFLDHWDYKVNSFYNKIFNIWILKFYKKSLDNYNKVLDVWCWSWDFYIELKNIYKNINFTGIDFNDEQILNFKNRLPWILIIKGSTTDYGKVFWKFDIIHCRSVLQYVDDFNLNKTINNFNNYLNDDWKVILVIKNSNSLYWIMREFLFYITKKEKKEFYRSIKFYEKIMNKKGFILENKYWYWIKPFLPFEITNSIFYNIEAFLRFLLGDLNFMNNFSTQVYLSFKKKKWLI